MHRLSVSDDINQAPYQASDFAITCRGNREGWHVRASARRLRKAKAAVRLDQATGSDARDPGRAQPCRIFHVTHQACSRMPAATRAAAPWFLHRRGESRPHRLPSLALQRARPCRSIRKVHALSLRAGSSVEVQAYGWAIVEHDEHEHRNDLHSRNGHRRHPSPCQQTETTRLGRTSLPTGRHENATSSGRSLPTQQVGVQGTVALEENVAPNGLSRTLVLSVWSASQQTPVSWLISCALSGNGSAVDKI